MDSSRNLLLLLGLILVMNLGLRRTTAPADSGRASGQFGGDSSDPSHLDTPAAVPDSPGLGSGAASRGRGFRWGRSPLNGGQPIPDNIDTASSELSFLIQGLESAATPEERGAWADQIAARGGTAAVEALVRASLDRRSSEEVEVLHEAFKGFSTEEEMGALATHLVQTDDHDLIEAMVETVARGARSSTVEQLIRLHEELSTPPAARDVVGWAIERIRNPEAEGALVRWLDVPERPDWANPGIIALSALQAQRLGEEVSPP